LSFCDLLERYEESQATCRNEVKTVRSRSLEERGSRSAESTAVLDASNYTANDDEDETSAKTCFQKTFDSVLSTGNFQQQHHDAAARSLSYPRCDEISVNSDNNLFETKKVLDALSHASNNDTAVKTFWTTSDDLLTGGDQRHDVNYPSDDETSAKVVIPDNSQFMGNPEQCHDARGSLSFLSNDVTVTIPNSSRLMGDNRRMDGQPHVSESDVIELTGSGAVLWPSYPAPVMDHELGSSTESHTDSVSSGTVVTDGPQPESLSATASAQEAASSGRHLPVTCDRESLDCMSSSSTVDTDGPSSATITADDSGYVEQDGALSPPILAAPASSADKRRLVRENRSNSAAVTPATVRADDSSYVEPDGALSPAISTASADSAVVSDQRRFVAENRSNSAAVTVRADDFIINPIILEPPDGVGSSTVASNVTHSVENLSKSSVPVTLYGYQLELAARGCQGSNCIICAPTGSGKTFTAGFICRTRRDEVIAGGRSFKCLFVVCIRNLIVQQRDALRHIMPGDTNSLFSVTTNT